MEKRKMGLIAIFVLQLLLAEARVVGGEVVRSLGFI